MPGSDYYQNKGVWALRMGQSLRTVLERVMGDLLGAGYLS